MKRAPEVRMTEREFRCLKRRQMQMAVESLKRLESMSHLLPAGGRQKIRSATNAVQKAREELIDWWNQY